MNLVAGADLRLFSVHAPTIAASMQSASERGSLGNSSMSDSLLLTDGASACAFTKRLQTGLTPATSHVRRANPHAFGVTAGCHTVANGLRTYGGASMTG